MRIDVNVLSVQRSLDPVSLTHNDFKHQCECSTVRQAYIGTDTLGNTHTHTLRVDAGMAAIREHMFAQFHQPLNPYQPESSMERENKDIKARNRGAH